MEFEMLHFNQAFGLERASETFKLRFPIMDEGGVELSMSAMTQHGYAVYLFQQGYYEDAVMQLDEVIREEETGERWSDWATAQFALGRFPEAERGFRRALELTPRLPEAAINFGAMLVSLSRWKEAIDTLEVVLPALQPEERGAVIALVEQCRAQLCAGGTKRCDARNILKSADARR